NRNHAEALINSTEKSLAEHAEAVSADVKAEIETGIEELKTALKDGTPEDITTKTAALTQTAMKLGEAIYKATQEAAASADASADANSEKPDDDVVDADFEEVDEADRDKGAKAD